MFRAFGVLGFIVFIGFIGLIGSKGFIGFMGFKNCSGFRVLLQDEAEAVSAVLRRGFALIPFAGYLLIAPNWLLVSMVGCSWPASFENKP